MKALHARFAFNDVSAHGAGRRQSGNRPQNRLLWRANMRRLDAEAMRDSLLAVTGELDATADGPSLFADPKNVRRTVYGLVSRRKLDGTLALFDFPNANATSEKRSVTITPTQQLYFLNSDFLMDRAKHLAAKVQDVNGAYAVIFGRAPSAGNSYRPRVRAEGARALAPVLQALLTSNEFVFVN
jgi:hypothetical protein